MLVTYLERTAFTIMANRNRTPSPNKPFRNFINLIRKNSFMSAILSGIVLAAIIGAFNLAVEIRGISKDLDDIKKQFSGDPNTLKSDISNQELRITDLEKNVQGINSDISGLDEKFSSLIDEVDEYKSRVDDVGDKIDSLRDFFERAFLQFGLRPNESLAQAITASFNSRDALKSNENGIVKMSSESSVAYNVFTKIQYTANELASSKLLLPYKDGNDDVFFYGQFDESGSWDGVCLINIYEDGNLKLIVDAEYNSGALVKSKQVFHYTLRNSDQQEVWAISDRIVQDGYSSGETRLYVWNGDYKQTFANDDVVPENMISADVFLSSVNLQLYAYYSGNTSNGYFNDNTGEAYMIYINEDGTVRTLYVGKFVDGYFTDDSGKAWWITEDDNFDYGYYEGPFFKSEVMDYGRYRYNISKEDVEKIISEHGREFDFELKWRGKQSV